MIGDMNVIDSNYDKKGGIQRKDYSNREFKRMINDRGLIDLGYSGPAFTWTNDTVDRSPIYERLDRVL